MGLRLVIALVVWLLMSCHFRLRDSIGGLSQSVTPLGLN